MRIEDLRDLPGHLIRRAHQMSGALFAARLAPHDLTPVQYAALVAVRSHPGIDGTRLAEMIASDKATAGGVIERLEAKALLLRAPSKTDRRTKTATLTREGETLLTAVEPQVLLAQADILGPLNEAEQAAFQTLLRKLVDGR